MTIKEREAGWSWARRKEAKRARLQAEHKRYQALFDEDERREAAEAWARDLERFSFGDATATATVTKSETATIGRLETDRKAGRIYDAIMRARTW